MVMFHLVVAAHLKIKVEMAHPKLKIKAKVEMAHQVLMVMPRLEVKMPPMVKKTALIVMFRLRVAAHLKIKVEMAHQVLMVMLFMWRA